MSKKLFTFFFFLPLFLFGLGNISWGQYSGTGTFTKISSLTDLTDGYYVIAYGTTYAMNNTNSGSYFGNTNISVSSNTITDPSTAIVWKIQNNSTYGGRTIYNETSAKYVSYTGTGNAAYAVSSIAGTSECWDFAYSSSLFTITNKGTTNRLLQYNTSTPRFACYISSQQNITLYKFNNSAPSVTTTSVSSISSIGATFNGNIASDGGSSITDRGFCYNTSSGVTINDNKTSEGGTSTGSFSKVFSNLSSQTKYYYKAYATNSIGTTLSSTEINFWTYSIEPQNHSSTFSNTVISQTQINLSFDAANTISNCAGYIILQKTSSIPTGLPSDGNAYSIGNTVGDATVAALVTSSSSTSANITGLTAGTTYYFTLIPYNYNGTNNETYNYRINGTIPSTNGTTIPPYDANSYVDNPATQVSAGSISSLVTSDGQAVEVYRFKITDVGGDAQPTKVTQVKINAGSNNTADWSTSIQGAKLSSDGGSTFITIGSTTINSSSMVFSISAGNLNISNGSSSTISLYIYLKSSGLIDDKILQFNIPTTSHGFTADGTGSTFASTFNNAVTSNQISISVVATKLVFSTQPSNTVIGVNMSPAVTVSATDANSNTDLDFIGNVSITSTGTLSVSPITVAAVSGIATFSTINHTALGTGLTLTATSSGLTDATSNTFNITVQSAGLLLLEENFDYQSGDKLTDHGWTAHSSPGTNPISVGSTGLTYDNYGSTGIGNSAILNNSGEDVNKTFTQQNSGSTTYAAFLINVTAASGGDYVVHFGPSNINSEYKCRFFIKYTSSSLYFGISTYGTTVNYSSNSYSYNTTYLIVIKHYFDGSSQTSSLYINPSLYSEPTPDATETSTTSLPTNIGSIALRQSSASYKFTIDGIRVGTGWGAVLGNPQYNGDENIATGNYNNISIYSGNLSLTGNANVKGTLNLSSGKVKLGNYNLALSSSSDITGFNSSNYVVTDGTGKLKIRHY